MLVRALRRFGSHKVLDVDGAAGARLARANSPTQVLGIVEQCQVTLTTKVFAMRRIASTLSIQTATEAFEKSPVYAKLREEMCAYISAASYSDMAGLVFWLRVSREKSPSTFQQVPTSDQTRLKSRIIEGANSGQFSAFQLIPLFHDFCCLNWDPTPLLPALTRLISNPHELISWEYLAQLLFYCHSTKNKAVNPIYEEIYERMRKSNLAFTDLQDLITLYEASTTIQLALNLPISRRIKEASLEATLRKLSSAPVFLLTKALKAFVKNPKELNPLIGYACEGLNRYGALFPIETVTRIVQFCGKLKIMGHPIPESVLQRVVGQLPTALLASSKGKLFEIVGALAVLRQNWPNSVYTALQSLRNTVSPGDWSCYAAVIMADNGQDYLPFLNDIRDLQGNDALRVIRLVTVSMLPNTPEIAALTSRYELDLLENAQETRGISLLPVLLNLEDRLFLPICSLSPRFLSAYLSISLPPTAHPSFEQLRLLFLCFPHFPLPVLFPLPTNRLIQFSKSLHYVRKAEDLLRFLDWAGSTNVNLEVLGRVLKCSNVGRRTPAGHRFRKMLNRAEGDVVECRVFKNYLETAFEIIEEDCDSCRVFLQNAVETIKTHLNTDFDYLPLLSKLVELQAEAVSLIPQVLKLASSSSKHPEILVKMAAGQLALFDAQLGTINLKATETEICDQIVAVLLRGDKRLLSALETSFSRVIKDYSIYYVASFLPKLRKWKQADQFRSIILEELKQKWSKEVLLPDICLSVLEASLSLRLSPSTSLLSSANEYLVSNLQNLSADQVLDFMYLMAAFGGEMERKVVEKTVDLLRGTREEVEAYGKYVLEVLYQMELLGTEIGGSVIRQYLEALEGRELPLKAVFPLLRANSGRTDLLSTISLSHCTLSQRLLYHLLTNSLTPALFSALLSPWKPSIRLENSQLILPATHFTVCNGLLYGDWKWIADLIQLQGIRVVSEEVHS